MTKSEFLLALRDTLSRLPGEDVEEYLNFYNEMIEDRMEEGLSEEEAVSSVGTVEEIVTQILKDVSLPKLVMEKIKPKKRLRAWEIVLLVLGSPIWLSLLLAACAVAFALWISLWAVIVSLWAVFVSVGASAFGGIVAGVGLAMMGNVLPGVALIALGFVCAGLFVFFFYGCRAATKGIVLLTKICVVWLKKRFMKKEEA